MDTILLGLVCTYIYMHTSITRLRPGNSHTQHGKHRVLGNVSYLSHNRPLTAMGKLLWFSFLFRFGFYRRWRCFIGSHVMGGWKELFFFILVILLLAWWCLRSSRILRVVGRGRGVVDVCPAEIEIEIEIERERERVAMGAGRD